MFLVRTAQDLLMLQRQKRIVLLLLMEKKATAMMVLGLLLFLVRTVNVLPMEFNQEVNRW